MADEKPRKDEPRPGEIVNPSPDPDDEFAEFRPVIRALARKIVRYGLTTPAIILLEAERPLNWILSQGLHVINPTLSLAAEFLSIASHDDLDRFARFLERREAFGVLIEEIERQEALREELRRLERGDRKRKKAKLPHEELR